MRYMFTLVLLLLSGSAGAQSVDQKFDPRLRDRMAAAPSDRQSVWLYLDANARDDEPIELTEAARRRRARVDPVNLLIDEHDYPIRADLLDQISATGVTVRRVSRWLGAVSVSGSAVQIARAAAIASVEQVTSVATLVAPPHPEPERAVLEPPRALIDDGLASFQHRFVNADRLHDAGLTGDGVLLAFFDSGFETGHPAFDSMSLIAQRDFVQADDDVSGADCSGDPSSFHQSRHGTLTLGVVATNQPGSMIGMAPGCDFVLAKTEITCGGTEIKMEEDNWIAAAEWVDSIGVDIISSSLGYFSFQDSGSYTQSQLDGNTARITIAADVAAAKNILVVNSAGNDRLNSWGTIGFPADGDSVIAVGATNPDSTVASFSSPGPTADGRIKPDISALGVSVAAPNYASTGYTTASGTSLSAPLVAGGAALALEIEPTLTAADLRERIRTTGSLSDNPNNDLGYGILDAYATADRIRLSMPPVVTVNEGTARIPVEYTGQAELPAIVEIVSGPATVGLSTQGGLYVLDLPIAAGSGPLGPITLAVTDGRFADTNQVTVVIRAGVGAVRAGPNPFRDTVTFFAVSSDPIRSVTIFTPAGEKVWESVNNSTGSVDDLSTTWNGRNNSGSRVAAGVYLAVIETRREARTVKLLKTD